jgi:hypothetical protein
MTKLEELKNDVWRITEIFLNAKENFNYSYYLHRPPTNEEAEYLKNDRDLIFIRHSLWRLSIIELTKLFSDNSRTHKFNLLHFLSKLKAEGYYSEIRIDILKIAEWESLIFTEDKLINDVVTLRDKIYAHTDPDKDEYGKIEIYFNQIESLFELVESIIIEINLVAFNLSTSLLTPTFDRKDFTLVKILAQAKQNEINEILKHIKK